MPSPSSAGVRTAVGSPPTSTGRSFASAPRRWGGRSSWGAGPGARSPARVTGASWSLGGPGSSRSAGERVPPGVEAAACRPVLVPGRAAGRR
eukprot:8684252-Pyramimonas_sp.AAC.1